MAARPFARLVVVTAASQVAGGTKMIRSLSAILLAFASLFSVSAHAQPTVASIPSQTSNYPQGTYRGGLKILGCNAVYGAGCSGGMILIFPQDLSKPGSILMKWAYGMVAYEKLKDGYPWEEEEKMSGPFPYDPLPEPNGAFGLNNKTRVFEHCRFLGEGQDHFSCSWRNLTRSGDPSNTVHLYRR